jgi:RNA polymerase sigma-70 factor (ECF subfamily)
MDTKDWIELARQGDLEAFNQLVNAYQDVVFNQAYRLLGDRQDAEDVTQKAFLAAYHKFSQFRGDSFRAWILKIVTNLCMDELRRRKSHPNLPLEPVGEDGEEFDSPAWLVDSSISPEEYAERSELRSALQRCLDRLPDEYRTAVVLVDVQGIDYAEAASILGVPVGTLKSRLARGRAKMLLAWQNQVERREKADTIKQPAGRFSMSLASIGI